MMAFLALRTQPWFSHVTSRQRYYNTCFAPGMAILFLYVQAFHVESILAGKELKLFLKAAQIAWASMVCL